MTDLSINALVRNKFRTATSGAEIKYSQALDQTVLGNIVEAFKLFNDAANLGSYVLPI